MKDFLNHGVIIAYLGVIVVVITVILGRDFPKKAVTKIIESLKNAFAPDDKGSSFIPNIPKEPSEWIIEQLDPTSLSVVKSVSMDLSNKACFTIGRSKQCDFYLQLFHVINEPSRTHIEIVRNGHGYIARDCGSSNGTFINNRTVTEFFLRDNLEVWLAGYPIRFKRNPAFLDSSESPTQVFMEDKTLKYSVNHRR